MPADSLSNEMYGSMSSPRQWQSAGSLQAGNAALNPTLAGPVMSAVAGALPLTSAADVADAIQAATSSSLTASSSSSSGTQNGFIKRAKQEMDSKILTDAPDSKNLDDGPGSMTTTAACSPMTVAPLAPLAELQTNLCVVCGTDFQVER